MSDTFNYYQNTKSTISENVSDHQKFSGLTSNSANTELNTYANTMTRAVYRVSNARPSSSAQSSSTTTAAANARSVVVSPQSQQKKRKCCKSKYFYIALLLALSVVCVVLLLLLIFHDDLFVKTSNETVSTSNSSKSSPLAANNRSSEKFRYYVIVGNNASVDHIIANNSTESVNHVSLNETLRDSQKTITFENFINGDFIPQSFDFKWLSGDELLFYDIFKNLRVVNVSRKSDTLLIPNTTVFKYQLSGVELSADRKYLLTRYRSKKLFRYSSLSSYKIYDIKKSHSYKLSNENTFDDASIRVAVWGPIGSQLIFVYRNNIYYKPNVRASSIRLTDTGHESLVYNGVPDWVYEEEIIEGPKTFWVSPDGRRIAFANIDDTNVETMSWPIYGRYDIDGSVNQYTKMVSVRYPKPGRPNPVVSLWVMSLTDLPHNSMRAEYTTDTEPQLLKPPEEIIEKGDHYFTSLNWIDNQSLIINWMTRAQNHSILSVYSKRQHWEPSYGFKLQSKNGWITIFKPPLITPDKKSYLIPLPKLVDPIAQEYYTHVAKILIKSGDIKYLTTGRIEVKDLLRISNKSNEVYFTAVAAAKPGERHLMSVSLDESVANPNPYCHTCAINANKDNQCLVSNAEFSDTGENYVLDCRGPDVPFAEIYSANNDTLLANGLTNDFIYDSIENISLPTRIIMKVPVEDGFENDVIITVPPGFSEDSGKLYPLVMHVYGGPGSDMPGVSKEYFLNQFGAFLSANRSLIYALIDSRGGSNHGSKFMYEIYKKFGTVEVSDTIAVARYFRDNVSYVDPNRISVWGWSYGGYLTTMALAGDYKDPVFKCGVAVAPVADWLFYDSVYVERYMGFPTEDDNLENYRKSSTLNKVKHLRGKQFLVMFGTADDNVHSQNAMMLMKALNDANINYETHVYPDEAHGIHKSSNYLYRTVVKFFDKCFAL